MKTTAPLLLTLLLFALPRPAHAQRGRDPNAGQLPDRDTIETINESNQERAELSRRLEIVYQKRVERIRRAERQGDLPPGRAEAVLRALAGSQSAWQEFRRRQCEFVFVNYGHRAKSLKERQQGMWEYEKKLIEQRIDELEDDPDPF